MKREEFTPQLLKDAIKRAKKVKNLFCPKVFINGKEYYMLRISEGEDKHKK